MASNDTEGNRPVLKVIVLGDSGVGKSTMVNIFRAGFIDKNFTTTVGVDVYRKNVHFADKWCILEIRDVAGQERYRSVCPSYYRGCHACILMFALDNFSSYHNLFLWYRDILEHVPDTNFPLMVVGNKSDLIRDIPLRCVREWCSLRDINTYHETSCKDFGSIALMFEIAMMKAYIYRRRQNQSDVIATGQNSVLLPSTETMQNSVLLPSTETMQNSVLLPSGENEQRDKKCCF